MILLLDTSTGECRLTLINHTNEQFDYVWQADRELSNGLLKFIVDKLKIHNKTVYERVLGDKCTGELHNCASTNLKVETDEQLKNPS